MERIDKRLLEPETRTMEPSKAREEWARHGCRTNEEWHAYLKKCSDYDLVPPEKNGCYY